GRQRNASQERPRTSDAGQAEGLRDAGSSARRPTAPALRDEGTGQTRNMSTATNRTYATGKRKTAIARVWLSPGTGSVTVNERPADQYFERETSIMVMKQ